jgi:hypothetical protein
MGLDLEPGLLSPEVFRLHCTPEILDYILFREVQTSHQPESPFFGSGFKGLNNVLQKDMSKPWPYIGVNVPCLEIKTFLVILGIELSPQAS